jgi:copper transport protein
MKKLLFVALLALVALPAPALAHAHLTGTKPAANARLMVAPRQLVLTFSESPALAMSSLRLVGPDSAVIALGAVTHDAGVRTLSASIVGPLAAGRYTVEWQTAGDDGHVQHGSYQFVIAEDASGLAPPPTAVTTTQRGDSARLPDVSVLDSAVGPMNATSFDASSPIYVVIRWVQFVALLLLIGAVAFHSWILPRAGAALADATRQELGARAASVGSWGAWLLAASAVARLLAQGATLHGANHMADPVVLGPMITRTIWGHAWMLEIIAVIVAIVCLHLARRQSASPLPWRVATVVVFALALVPALSGHAVATPEQAGIAVIADAMHVLGAGAWLGSLAVIVVAGLPVMTRESAAGRTSALSAVVNSFSSFALGCAALVVLTGVIAARYHLGSWAAFTTTSYGETLLVKLAVVFVLLCIAAWNWQRVRPSLARGEPGDVRRIRGTAGTETGVAIVVLLITAILVALPTPVDVVR